MTESRNVLPLQGGIREDGPTAIVLAAGAGRRLLPHTEHVPKPLVPVAGEPILLRMLKQLRAVGVGRVCIVVGDRADQVRASVEAAGLTAEWVVSPDYATTNNSFSLWLAREFLRAGTILVEGDVICDTQLLRELIDSSAEDCWAVVPFSAGMDGALLRGEPGGYLQSLEIVRGATPSGPPGFKSTGLLKLGSRSAPALRAWLDLEIASGRRDRYFDLVIADHLPSDSLRLHLAHGRWLEIDTPEDLARARTLFESRE